MPYKDPADQRASRRRFYFRNQQAEIEHKRRYRRENRERLNAKARIPRELWKRRSSKPGSQRHCKVCYNAYQRQYRLVRRQRERVVEGVFTCEDIARIRLAQKDRCGYCRVKLKGKGTIDHIKPLALGGTNWPSNIQLLCRSCNSAKWSHDPIAFARKRGLLL